MIAKAFPAAQAISTAPTVSEAVLDRLRGDIVAGAIAPQARLAMKELTQRYGVGLSPLREALHRLAGEGFVLFFGQRGFKVPPISLADLEDLTELRLMVEAAAVKQAVVRGGDAWEAGLVAAFHTLELQIGRFGRGDEASIRRYDAAHRAFHVAMFEGVVAPRLAALHANLFDQAYRYRKLLHAGEIRPAEVLREHRRLLQLLLTRDEAAAGAALGHHLTLTREAWRREAKKQGQVQPKEAPRRQVQAQAPALVPAPVRLGRRK